MHAAVKPYLTAGAAVLALGAVSINPAQAAGTPQRVTLRSYSLTAAETGLAASAVAGSDSAGNLAALFASIPAWEVQAMNRFADAMIATGPWQVWGPTNVFGFDELDPPKLKALIDMTLPILPISSVLGEQISVWAQANLPMNAGCAAKPGACPDLNALVDGMFKVPTSQLNDGYQFPTVTNPFTGEPTSWSGTYVKLDPAGPINSLQAYLDGPPQAVESVSFGDFATAAGRVTESVRDAFNPFVPNSEWFNIDQTGLADVFRALAPNFCPSCNPDKPYDNPWLYDNYPPKSAAAAPAAATAETVSAVVAADPVTVGSDAATPDVAEPAPEVAAASEPEFAAPVDEPAAADAAEPRAGQPGAVSGAPEHKRHTAGARRGSRTSD